MRPPPSFESRTRIARDRSTPFVCGGVGALSHCERERARERERAAAAGAKQHLESEGVTDSVAGHTHASTPETHRHETEAAPTGSRKQLTEYRQPSTCV